MFGVAERPAKDISLSFSFKNRIGFVSVLLERYNLAILNFTFFRSCSNLRSQEIDAAQLATTGLISIFQNW